VRRTANAGAVSSDLQNCWNRVRLPARSNSALTHGSCGTVEFLCRETSRSLRLVYGQPTVLT